MPINKNAIMRYKILDELLSDRYHNYTLDDLTKEVNRRLAEMRPNGDCVVRRTIEKDIHFLENEGPFWVEIERYSVDYDNYERNRTYRKQCLRYADSSFSIFKQKLFATVCCLKHCKPLIINKEVGEGSFSSTSTKRNEPSIFSAAFFVFRDFGVLQ